MDELLELLKAVPNSYEDFVECVSQLAVANQDKIDSLIDYIKSKDRENPADILRWVTDNGFFPDDDEEVDEEDDDLNDGW